MAPSTIVVSDGSGTVARLDLPGCVRSTIYANANVRALAGPDNSGTVVYAIDSAEHNACSLFETRGSADSPRLTKVLDGSWMKNADVLSQLTLSPKGRMITLVNARVEGPVVYGNGNRCVLQVLDIVSLDLPNVVIATVRTAGKPTWLPNGDGLLYLDWVSPSDVTDKSRIPQPLSDLIASVGLQAVPVVMQFSTADSTLRPVGFGFSPTVSLDGHLLASRLSTAEVGITDLRNGAMRIIRLDKMCDPESWWRPCLLGFIGSSTLIYEGPPDTESPPRWRVTLGSSPERAWSVRSRNVITGDDGVFLPYYGPGWLFSAGGM
jgi:hypothetical protein